MNTSIINNSEAKYKYILVFAQVVVTSTYSSYYLTRGDAGSLVSNGYTSMPFTNCAAFCNYIFTNGFGWNDVFWAKCYTQANGLNDNQIIDPYYDPNICVVQGNNVTDCSWCKPLL